jgi:hypothetical protein
MLADNSSKEHLMLVVSIQDIATTNGANYFWGDCGILGKK